MNLYQEICFIYQNKSYKDNSRTKGHIKRLNNEILELVQIEEFDQEMSISFLFSDEIHWCLGLRLFSK